MHSVNVHNYSNYNYASCLKGSENKILTVKMAMSLSK